MVLEAYPEKRTPDRRLSRGTQRPNVSKYARSVSNGFLCALEACLVNLEFRKYE